MPNRTYRTIKPRRARRHWAPILLAATLGLCAAARPAQAIGPSHGLGAGLDVGLHSVRDDVLAPIAFSGPQLAIAPHYFGVLGGGLLSADARLGGGYVLDRAGAEGVTFRWALHAGYYPLLYHGQWRVALGPALGWDNDLFYLADWDDAHAYWLGTLWVGPGVRAWRWLGARWRMDLGGTAALVGFQSRTPDGRRKKQELSEDHLFASILEPPARNLRLGSFAYWQVANVFLTLHRTNSHAHTPNGWGIGAELGLSRASRPDLAFTFNATLRLSYTWGVQ